MDRLYTAPHEANMMNFSSSLRLSGLNATTFLTPAFTAFWKWILVLPDLPCFHVTSYHSDFNSTSLLISLFALQG